MIASNRPMAMKFAEKNPKTRFTLNNIQRLACLHSLSREQGMRLARIVRLWQVKRKNCRAVIHSLLSSNLPSLKWPEAYS